MNTSTKFRWSTFRVRVALPGGLIIVKSTLTGAVITIDKDTESALEDWFAGRSTEPAGIAQLLDPDTALIVPLEHDEFTTWRKNLVDRRNNHAHTFILHFLPTIQCQLRCHYCFENEGDRGKGMRIEMVEASRKWLESYLNDHPEIDQFRLVLFGGEPLLKKEIVYAGLEAFHSLAIARGIEFWCELTSNGELLDEAVAKKLAAHEWRRVQITIDGPEDIHDSRRHGTNERPTFRNIMKNVEMLLSTEYIPSVDIRMSLDLTNADRLPELVRFLAAFGKQDKISLSIGLITPTLANQTQEERESLVAEKVIAVWKVAQECGFKIPEEFITGPWCVAIAKHSAILQPDGGLQKCFCTAGRKAYDFGTVQEQPKGYLKDPRFEHFRRTDQCIEEKCAFLPMCGGGCIHDAVVENGGPDGFDKRYCQKTLLAEVNRGLIEMAIAPSEIRT